MRYGKPKGGRGAMPVVNNPEPAKAAERAACVRRRVLVGSVGVLADQNEVLQPAAQQSTCRMPVQTASTLPNA